MSLCNIANRRHCALYIALAGSVSVMLVGEVWHHVMGTEWTLRPKLAAQTIVRVVARGVGGLKSCRGGDNRKHGACVKMGCSEQAGTNKL